MSVQATGMTPYETLIVQKGAFAKTLYVGTFGQELAYTEKAGSIKPGTRTAVFNGIVNNVPCKKVLRIDVVFQETVNPNLETEYQALSPFKKRAFSDILRTAVSLIAKEGEFIQACMRACDPAVAQNKISESKMIQSIVLDVVKKHIKDQAMPGA